MQIVRFIVTVAFAWMLVRATFANTVQWRHPHVSGQSTVHREQTRAALASAHNFSRHGMYAARD